ncbi:MAG: MgtC/SapB family protein [Candidatus Pacearchaeota archaeon]
MVFHLSQTEIEILIKIFFAVVVGFVIGLERKAKQYGLGSRTSMLICVGACLFTIVGSNVLDPSNFARIAQGLAAGVGFIGAAIIWQQKQDHMWIHGLTSAASVWVLTALGFAIGAGAYFVAIVATVCVLIILLIKRIGFE